MFDCTDTTDADIAQHEVSEDGVNWRPYDPARHQHTRIIFAEPQDE